MVYCPYCGVEIVNGASYCFNCGKKISETDDETETNTKNPHRTAITLGWLGVLFFAPLALIMGLYLISQEDKNSKKNGWWIFGITSIWLMIWFFLIVPLLVY